jgi:hypothetical protein
MSGRVILLRRGERGTVPPDGRPDNENEMEGETS